jgi:hypothetical protein
MTRKENLHGNIPARAVVQDIRVTATFQRDGATSLQDLLQWTRQAADMGVTLTGLEIDVDDSGAS